MLDLKSGQGAYTDKRLRTDLIGWLTTVGVDGRPYTSPVWFLWYEGYILIFSQPDKQKVRNLRTNARVTLALDDTKLGEDVVVVEGKAELLEASGVNTTLAAYREKYDASIKELGLTPASMAASYSQAIRVTPTRFNSWRG